MGVDVEVRHPLRGKRPTRANVVSTVSDGRNLFVDLVMRARVEGRMPILARVKPWADAAVYDGEFIQLLQELNALSAHASSDAERDVLRDIEAAVATCIDHGGLELHFVGD
jgi:hypothetical protein